MNEQDILKNSVFGGIEREQNPQDFTIGSFTPDGDIPKTFSVFDHLPIEMQGKQPACGSHAGNYLKEVFAPGFHGSPKFLWKEIKKIDGYPVEAGTDMVSILKAMKNIGICSYSLMANDTSVSLEEYANPSVLTPQLTTDAGNHTIGAYAFQFTPTFDQIKQALYHHGPIILLLRVGKEFYTDKDGNVTWEEAKILPLRATEPIDGGHFVCAYGYDETAIYFYQAWSDAWGRQGIGYFTTDYAARVVELGTAVDVKKAVFEKDLDYGMTGPDVKIMQLWLIAHGYNIPAGATGNYFDQTKAAVGKFQADHGIHVLNQGMVWGPRTREQANLLNK